MADLQERAPCHAISRPHRAIPNTPEAPRQRLGRHGFQRASGLGQWAEKLVFPSARDMIPAMADSACVPSLADAVATSKSTPRHAAMVRITHWVTALCFLALLVSGVEILLSHPRFYWGETGNVLDEPLFRLPLPASRRYIPTGYGYVLPDQNGWSRSLHFQAAWAVVFAALLYGVFGAVTGHFRKNLIPEHGTLSGRALFAVVGNHVRFRPPGPEERWSYNVLQRITYLLIIFVLFPLMIWTGLAMSPAIASIFPRAVTLLGGQQSARTIHFFATVLLVLFVVVHVAMIWKAGFRSRVRAMVTGKH